MTTGTIIQWDYKEQPDWDKINEAIDAQCDPCIFPVESGSDQFAIVIASIDDTQELAQEYFDEHKFDEPV